MPNCLSCGEKSDKVWTSTVDLEYKSTPDNYFYFSCKYCNSVFIDPIPLHKLNIIYPDNYYSYNIKNNFISKIKDQIDKYKFRNILSKIEKSEISILDIGGGDGHKLDLCKSIDSRVSSTTIIDINNKVQSLAQSKGHYFILSSVEDYNFARKYDLVLAYNLIEHLNNPKHFLSKISGLLDDDGLLVIQTPNIDCVDAICFGRQYWAGLHCPRHWILFNETSLRNLISSVGLNTYFLTYIQGASFVTMSILFLLEKIGLTKITSEIPADQNSLFPLLVFLTAPVEIFRSFFFKTSQMLVLVKKYV